MAAADDIPPPDDPLRILTRRQVLKVGASAFAGLLFSRLPVPPVACALTLGDDELPLSERDRWFDINLGAIRDGNEAVELIDAPATFAKMVESIRSATTSDHFVYLVGWWLDDSFRLVPNVAGTDMRALLTQASDAGAEIRAVLWDQRALYANGPNVPTRDHINAMANGGAIVDNRHVTQIGGLGNVGSHHQKLMIVNGGQGLVAYVGGIDINADRMYAVGVGPNANGDTQGAPLHDVHCRIRGPAAWDVLRIFVERWNWPDLEGEDQLHPEVRALPAAKQSLRGAALPQPAAIAAATCSIAIGRTYGNGNTRHGIQQTNDDPPQPRGYPFAPDGTQQTARMIIRGIQNARQLIYCEDQYFVDTAPNVAGVDVRAELIAALTREENPVERLIVVIPHGSITDLSGGGRSVNQANHRRGLIINELRSQAGNDKIRVFVRAPAPNPHTYVHTKVWIFDDQCAVIGSANCNRRSWTHDSESIAVIWDRGRADRSTLRLPHRLRMRLWAEHLNIDTLEKLADGLDSVKYWLDLPLGAKVAEYDYSVTTPVPGPIDSVGWGFIDPDGS